jgi:hypothetical protein
MLELRQLTTVFDADLQSVMHRDFIQGTIDQTLKDISSGEIVSLFSERAMIRLGKQHNLAICRELKRREDAVNAAKLAEIKKQNETIERRKCRNEMREELRIQQL